MKWTLGVLGIVMTACAPAAPVKDPDASPSVAIEALPAPSAVASVEQPAAKEKAKTMNNERLGAILKELALDITGDTGAWEFRVTTGGRNPPVRLMCITDERHDRMRIVTPVLEVSKMTPEQLASVLDANFHTALDARYATHDGTLFSAFIHPLSPLTEAQVKSAVDQVATLALSFGTTYTSGELRFGR